MEKERYGEVIRIARIANDLSAKELAQLVGKSSTIISNLEHNKSRVSFDTFKKISKALNLRPHQLMELVEKYSELKEVENLARENNFELFKISGVTGEGIKDLMVRVSELLKELPKEELIEESEERVIYTLKDDKDEFEIEIIDGEYVVSGPAVERLMGRVNIQDNESMHYFQRQLSELGIEAKLKEMGIKEGDSVKILEWEFEWYN